MWFALQADIAEAKELPKPDVTRMEFNMKDVNIRNTIMETRDDVKKLEERMIRMEDKIDKLRGMDIAITTSAKTDNEAKELLESFNFPFRGKNG